MTVDLVRSSGNISTDGAAFTASLDCTGANLILVKLFYGGSSSNGHAVPKIDSVAMTSASVVDEYQGHAHIYTKVNPAQGTVDVDFASFSESLIARVYVIECYSGVDTSAPFYGVESNHGSNKTEFLLSFTSVGADDLITFGANYTSTNTSREWTPPAGSSEHYSRASGESNATSAATIVATGDSTQTFVLSNDSGNAAIAAGIVLKSIGANFTARKGSTFTVTHGLGTAPDSVTINALACTITNATTTTVDVTVDAAITTSGEYDMVIEDTVAVTSETQTVQVNVIGLPAYTLNKDGSALGNLTGVKAVVTATGEIDGTELYSANDLTATAGVMDSGIYLATGEDGDAVTVSILTGAGEGITFNDALELL